MSTAGLLWTAGVIVAFGVIPGLFVELIDHLTRKDWRNDHTKTR